MVGVQQWAEIRAMHAVEWLAIKEITRRTGHSRDTIRAAPRVPMTTAECRSMTIETCRSWAALRALAGLS